MRGITRECKKITIIGCLVQYALGEKITALVDTALVEGPSIEHREVSPTKAQRADEYIVVREEVVLAGRM